MAESVADDGDFLMGPTPVTRASAIEDDPEDGWSYAGVHEGDSSDMPEHPWLPSEEGGTEASDGIMNACVGSIDRGIGQGDFDGIEEDALELALSCNGEPDFEQCVRVGLQEQHGISSGCASCFTVHAICLIEQCLVACAVTTDDQECVCCLESHECQETLIICTGLPHDPDDGCH